MTASIQQLAKGSAIIFASLVIVRGLGFVKSIVFARLLCPDDFGIYGIVFNIYQIMLVIATFGIPIALTKYIAEYANDTKKAKTLFSNGLAIVIVLSIMISAIYVSISPYIASAVYNKIELSYYMMLSAAALIFAALNTFILAYFQGIQKMRELALLNTLYSVIFLISSFIFLNFFGLIGAFYALLLTSTLSLTFGVLMLKHHRIDTAKFKFSIEQKTIKKLLTFSLPLFLSSITVLPAYLVGQSWLGIMYGYNQVGYLQVALSLQVILLFIPSAIGTNIFPWFSTMSSENGQIFLRKRIPQLTKIIIFIIGFMMIVAVPISGYFIVSLYGMRYASSIALFQWLLIDTLFISQIVVYNNYVRSIGKNYIILKLDLLALVFLIPLLFIMINTYSAIGLIWSLIIVRVIVLMLYQRFISNQLGSTARECLFAPTFSAIIIILMILIYDTSLIQFIYLFVALAVYVATYKMYIFDEDDLQKFRTILRMLFLKNMRGR